MTGAAADAPPPGDHSIPALAEALQIPGARRVALVAEGSSVPAWSSTPGGPDEPIEGTATVAVVMVQAARELLRLTAGGDIDDLLLTSGDFFHVLRLVERPGRGAEVVHLTLHRSGANLAMARHQFRHAATMYRDGPYALGAAPGGAGTTVPQAASAPAAGAGAGAAVREARAGAPVTVIEAVAVPTEPGSSAEPGSGPGEYSDSLRPESASAAEIEVAAEPLSVGSGAAPARIVETEPASIADAEPARIAEAELASLADSETAPLADAEPAPLADAEPAPLADAEPEPGGAPDFPVQSDRPSGPQQGERPSVPQQFDETYPLDGPPSLPEDGPAVGSQVPAESEPFAASHATADGSLLAGSQSLAEGEPFPGRQPPVDGESAAEPQSSIEDEVPGGPHPLAEGESAGELRPSVEAGSPEEFEPLAESRSAAEFRPLAEAGGLAESQPLTDAESAAESRPLAEAGAFAESQPLADGEPDVEFQPLAELDPIAEPHLLAGDEPTVEPQSMDAGVAPSATEPEFLDVAETSGAPDPSAANSFAVPDLAIEPGPAEGPALAVESEPEADTDTRQHSTVPNLPPFFEPAPEHPAFDDFLEASRQTAPRPAAPETPDLTSIPDLTISGFDTASAELQMPIAGSHSPPSAPEVTETSGLPEDLDQHEPAIGIAPVAPESGAGLEPPQMPPAHIFPDFEVPPTADVPLLPIYDPPSEAAYQRDPYQQHLHQQDAHQQDPYPQNPHRPDPHQPDLYQQLPYLPDPSQQDVFQRDMYQQDVYQQDTYQHDIYRQDAHQREAYPENAYPHGGYEVPAQTAYDDPAYPQGPNPYGTARRPGAALAAQDAEDAAARAAEENAAHAAADAAARAVLEAGYVPGYQEPDAAWPGYVPRDAAFPVSEPPPYLPPAENPSEQPWPGETMPTSGPAVPPSGDTLTVMNPHDGGELLPRRPARDGPAPEPDPGLDLPVLPVEGEVPSLLSLLNQPFTNDSPTLDRIMSALRDL